MTDADPASPPSPVTLAAWSAAEVLAHFLASPTGRRFRACDPAELWDGLRPAIRLAAAIELSGLSQRRALNVHYVGHGYEDALDEGRWLQMAKCFLPSSPRLEITMRTAPEVERGRLATASPLAGFVSEFSPARRRASTKDALFEPLRGKADLVIFSPRPFIWEEAYRPFADVVPTDTRLVLADEADAATLALAGFLDDLGAVTQRQWIDALDDPEPDEDADEPRLVHSALLVHLIRHPDRVPPPMAWRACQELVPWSIRLLTAARKSQCEAPLWPGCRYPARLGEGPVADVIFAHPYIYVDAHTGAVLDLPEGQEYHLPPEILARHPGADRHPRHRAEAADLAWASEAAAALQACHAALMQLDDDLHARIDAQLQALGETPPQELPTEFTGLFAAVQRDDHEGILDRIMLRRAPPDQRGPLGMTPLMLAARLGRTESLGVLLECHANARLRDEHGWTALAHAAYRGQIDAVALLMRYGRSGLGYLGSGVPEALFCVALLSAHSQSPHFPGIAIPDAAPLIRAWREGVLHESELSAFGATIAAHEKPLAAASPNGALSAPPYTLPDPDQPTSALTQAVREAIHGPYPTQPSDALSAHIPTPPSAPVRGETPPALTSTAPSLAEPPLRPQDTPPQPDGPSPDVTEADFAAPPVVSAPAAPQRTLGSMSVVATVAGTLGHLAPDLAPTHASRAARDAVLTWLRTDKGLPLPDQVDDVFQLDLPNATVLSDAVPGLWTLRYDDRDRLVAGRTWRTEVVIGTTDDRSFGSIRLVRISPSPDDDGSTAASIPKLVARVAAGIGLSDAGVPLRADPWCISSVDGVEALIRLLGNPARLQPVLVVTSQDPAWIGAASEPGSIAARLHGFAHLVTVHPAMTFTLTRELGRSLGVFGDACRLYRPGFTAADDPHSNPLFLRRTDAPARALVARIVQAAAGLAPGRVTEEEVPTFAFARALMARARQAEAGASADVGPSAERVHALEQSILALTQERDTWQQSYGELEAMARSREDELLLDRESLREEIDRLRAQNYHLRGQNDQLRYNVARKAGVDPAPVSYPDSWDVLETWAADVLGDDVVLTNKAIRAARKSHFQNIPLAYQALHLLKECYLPMRVERTPATVEAFATRCRELGLEISDTGQAVDDRRFKDAYRVTWMGRTYKLDQHISGSSSRDRALQFRCYFAFDQDQGAIIVGALPEHMENSLTRR